MLAAAKAAPDGSWGQNPVDQPVDPYLYLQTKTFVPLTPASPAQTAQYQQGAAAFHADNYDAAIASFDKVAADQTSPYHAAAAYSAARAALSNGNYAGGFQRIAALLSNPAMQEFYSATYDLTGTLAWQQPDARLLAARLAEISHLLTAPHDLVCQEPELTTLQQNASDDMLVLTRITSRTVMDQIRVNNPFADLAWTIAQPTSYTQPQNWAHGMPPQMVAFPGFEASGAKLPPDVEAAYPGLTQHAREEWLATKNPLWAYALAIRTTNPSDVALLQNARDILPSYASDPVLNAESWNVPSALSSLDAALFEQQVRILLMNGQPGAAIALMQSGLTPTAPALPDKLLSSTPGRRNGDFYAFIVNGGIRYYVSHQDLSGARAWLSQVKSVFRNQGVTFFGFQHGTFETREVDPGLRLMLAQSWPEFMADEVSISDDQYYTSNVGHLEDAAAFDLLPADELIKLSRFPGLNGPQRRTLLGAGWIRLYMLGRWPEFFALMPEVRDNFPELDTDIDNIEASWTMRTRKHLTLKMLLHFPGLSPHPQWMDQYSNGQLTLRNTPDLTAIDPYDHNDGNWWCSFDIPRTELDVAGTFFVNPVQDNQVGFDYDYRNLSGGYVYWPTGTFAPPQGNQNTDADYDYAVAQSLSLIKGDPLFGNIDYKELAQLAATQSGPEALTEHAVKWAKQSYWFTRLLGMDNALPETLHLAVRSTRYGCHLGPNWGDDSQSAYTQLQTLYPHSIWTDKTPYWFTPDSLSR
ncbi:hypothetical protein MXAZACID_17231 [Acidocella sp. MX-AZ02]|nr:hypothetical protein MXAZACID_17231 [Acidocella sp. MX-AZ02]